LKIVNITKHYDDSRCNIDNVKQNGGVLFFAMSLAQCGIAVHKKCLEILHCTCDQSPVSIKSVAAAGDHSTPDDQVPYLVKQCMSEIDRRGLTVKVSICNLMCRMFVSSFLRVFYTFILTVVLWKHVRQVAGSIH